MHSQKGETMRNGKLDKASDLGKMGALNPIPQETWDFLKMVSR